MKPKSKSVAHTSWAPMMPRMCWCLLLGLAFFGVVRIYILHKEALVVITKPLEYLADVPLLGHGHGRTMSPDPVTVHTQSATNQLDDGSLPESAVSPHLSQPLNSKDHRNATSSKVHIPSEGGIAACLLVLQDSFLLREWLAYHYTVLPLTRLIIALDPKNPPEAKRRILKVLKRYDSESTPSLHLDIQIWEGDSFLPEKVKETIDAYESYLEANNLTLKDLNLKQLERRVPNTPVKLSRNPQRSRQAHFVQECLDTHRQQGATWVLLTDTDEYVWYNTMDHDDDYYNHSSKSILYPDFASLGNHRSNTAKQAVVLKRRTEAKSLRGQLPSLPTTDNTNGGFQTIFDFLTQLQNACEQKQDFGTPLELAGLPKETLSNFFCRPCHRMPQLKFVSENSNSTLQQSSSDVSAWKDLNLVTESFVQHLGPDDTFNKIMLDVSKLSKRQEIVQAYNGIHNPNHKICSPTPATSTTSGADFRASLFRIHHYKGVSPLAVQERSMDYRGSTQTIAQGHASRKKVGGPGVSTWRNSDIHAWANLFTNKVGQETATMLLENPFPIEDI